MKRRKIRSLSVSEIGMGCMGFSHGYGQVPGAGYAEEAIREAFAQPYTSADLDWNDKRSRSSVEMNDPKSRPAIKGRKENIADYDVIFIGYPIWWDLAPRIINTFIESHDLKGKTVIPFATSGGSTLAGSAAALKKTYPALNWREGRLLNRADEKSIRNWVDNCKL